MNDSENGDFGFEPVLHWGADVGQVEEAAWLILDETGVPLAPLPAQS